MRVLSRKRTVLIAHIAAMVLAPAAIGQYIVSTMAGYIHFAEGGVWLEEKPFEFNAAQVVHVGDGQRLRTVDGRAEVMIIPGSFVRLAPGSEFEMIRGGLLSAEMKLNEGSAMIDLIGAMATDGISIRAGDALIVFEKSGLYRIDAPPNGDPSIRVYRGKANVQLNGETVALGNKRSLPLRASGEKLRAGKFNDSEQDALDQWNKERGTLLAVKEQEVAKERGWKMTPLEESAIFRCRAMGAGCPSASQPPPPVPEQRQPGGGGGAQSGGRR
jgi:hypothetical protein